MQRVVDFISLRTAAPQDTEMAAEIRLVWARSEALGFKDSVESALSAVPQLQLSLDEELTKVQPICSKAGKTPLDAWSLELNRDSLCSFHLVSLEP